MRHRVPKSLDVTAMPRPIRHTCSPTSEPSRPDPRGERPTRSARGSDLLGPSRSPTRRNAEHGGWRRPQPAARPFGGRAEQNRGRDRIGHPSVQRTCAVRSDWGYCAALDGIGAWLTSMDPDDARTPRTRQVGWHSRQCPAAPAFHSQALSVLPEGNRLMLAAHRPRGGAIMAIHGCHQA
jgi:hypothetical protein